MTAVLGILRALLQPYLGSQHPTRDAGARGQRRRAGLPTLAGYPPTATIAALSCRTAEYILRQKDWF